jgi:hypothetical protein
MIYAGIGSRKAPKDVLEKIFSLSRFLDSKGFKLRSGGAEGPDEYFALGSSQKEVLRPSDATQEAVAYVSKFHPAWERCGEYVRQLHGRNAQIIFGKDLTNPVDFVVCWTPNGKVVGGTATGIKMAQANKIDVYNLAIKADILRLKGFLHEI